MGFLYLVEQNDGVGVAAHLLGQLASFLVSYVSRRCTYEARNVETLSIFAHVDADQVIGTAKHIFGKFLGQIGLAHTRRTEEHEHTDRVVGVFQSHAVALDGFHHLLYGGILGNHGLFQLVAHHAKTGALGLGHALNGHACHHRYHISHFFLGHGLTRLVGAVAPGFVELAQLLLQLTLLVAVTGCQFVVLVLHRIALLCLQLFYLFLLGHNLGRYLGVLQMHTGSHLVHGVDGLVGEGTVGDVTLGELHARCDGVVGVVHMVVLLIAVLDVLQNLEGLLTVGGLHHHFLESSLKGTIFLNAVAVLVEGGGTNALDGATGKGRFQDVGGIHRTGCRACTDDGVHLIDKHDDVGTLLQFLDEGLDALLELTSVFGSCHYRGEVEAHQALVEEYRRGVVLHDELGKPFHDGTLAHTGLSDEDGVVLLAAAENFHHTLHLVLTAHNGVELAFRSGLGQVGREVVEHRGLARWLAGLCGGSSAIATTMVVEGHAVVIVLGVVGDA